MGVQGLWKILEPTAEPVQLESLRGKALAIDASIWIYHFLKAMRDPKGTVLAAAHIIGFFRRICKLLFFEIKPVFVFDGSPPLLKTETTSKRNERRVGREQTARSAANKLLTLQLQRANARLRDILEPNNVEIVGSVPEGAVYMDQLDTNLATDARRASSTSRDNTPNNQPFVQTDQYHLPEIGDIGPVRADDQRMLTQDELDEYAEQFTSQARGGFIDTSLVDFQSKEFKRMPIETQYQLLNTARMKSRLRMGYTANELNRMFPNEMEFSRFQINRVAQRNFFTQKLMNLVGLEEDLTRRVAGDKNKEYYLKKTNHGWSLSLENRHQSPPVQSEVSHQTIVPSTEEVIAEDVMKESVEEEEDDDDFEDVDIMPEAEEEAEEQEEDIDLTAEQNSKLDALFGLEAEVTRKSLYDQLLEETDIPKQECSSSTQLFRSLLFGNDEDEKSETNTEKEKPALVPWLEKGDSHFKEMQIAENESDPNFVNVNDIVSEDEFEEVPLTVQKTEIRGHEPSMKTSSNQIDLNDTEPVTHKPLLKKNEAVEEILESGLETVKEAPQPEKTPLIPVKHKYQQTRDNQEAEMTPEPAAVKETEEVDFSEGPEVKLTAEGAERAEDEARAAAEEDENIACMLVAEAEENERFARRLAETANRRWTQQDEMEYERHINTLREQFAKSSRDANNITTEMVQECQVLLQLFGIPYITAPAEAEAQCAQLRQLKLVDGIVTDDGDTFLFDDNTMVYRNMFSQSKFVEFYSTQQISRKLGLHREQLIDLAFLLGSDYTEGILGIGPITGVEILAEFGNLKEFAKWWSEAQRFPDEADLNTPLRRRLLKQFRSVLFLPDDFPNPTVVHAYMHPSVDKDTTKFSWGLPDLEGIRKYLSATAGWSQEKVDASVLPVVQEARRRELQRVTEKAMDQTSINDYYTRVVQNPRVGSKRAAQAAQNLRKRAKK